MTPRFRPATAAADRDDGTDLALKLWVVLARSFRAVEAHAEADIARHELTLAEFGVLEALYHKGPLLLGDLQRRILVSSGGVTWLVNRLVNEDQLEKTLKELTAQITSQSGAVLMMAKRAILGGMGLSLKDGLKNSMNIFLNELYRLEDSQEGLRALLEKRKPKWKNR